MATVTAPLEQVERVARRARRGAAGLPRAGGAASGRSSCRVGSWRTSSRSSSGRASRSSCVANRLDTRPDGWRIRWVDDDAVPRVCGDLCKRRSLPAERPLVYVGDGSRTAAPPSSRTASSPRRPGASTSPSEASRTSGSRPSTRSSQRSRQRLPTPAPPDVPTPVRPFGAALPPLPQPFDWELSTERFRAFGPDLANLWREGGAAPRRRRAGGEDHAAPGGVEVQPLDERDRADGTEAARARVRPPRVLDVGRRRGVIGDLVTRLAGLRPPLAPDPFESLVTSITAQQVSLFSAFAIRNRMIERFGERATHAYGVPDARAPRRSARGGARRASASPGARRSTSSGSRARDLDLDGLAGLADDEVARGITARPRARPVDGRVVPRAAPCAPARVARGRPRPAEGRRNLLRSDVHELGPRLDPFQNLSAHYLLVGPRVAAAG